MQIPDDTKTGIPEWIAPSVAMGILVLGMIGRLIDQKADRPDEPEPMEHQVLEGEGHD